MKKYTYPTRIQLNELPEEGQSYHFDRDSGELNHILQDLVGENAYTVDIFIQPMGNVFQISGDLHTEVGTQCARCGRDMNHPVDENFSELIVVEKPRPRSSTGSHSLSDGSSLFCNHISDTSFSLGEFVHEQIAANEPYVVRCQREDCESYLESAQEHVRAPAELPKENPFAVLKNFKPKH